MLRNSIGSWIEKLKGVLQKYIQVMEISGTEESTITEPSLISQAAQQNRDSSGKDASQLHVRFQKTEKDAVLISPVKFDFKNLLYEDLLEYQMRTQYERFDKKLP